MTWPCHTCRQRYTEETTGRGHFLLYKCRPRNLTFGIRSDWIAGKWLGSASDKAKFGISDMPETCKDYSK